MTSPIERYRQSGGWTRRELARRTGVSVATVAAWEKGVMPHARNLWKLAIIFNIDVIELINQTLDWRACQTAKHVRKTVSAPACNPRGGLP